MVGLHGRRAEPEPDRVSAGPLPRGLAGATVVAVAVRDGQLDEALAEVAGARPEPGAAVLHLSGSAEPEGLAALRAAGHPCGTFHPLIPLADPARAPELFHGGWVGVDGDAAAVDTSRAIAERLGARVLEIPPGAKARYHAAAVFASNFPVVLAALAGQLLRGAGLPHEPARQAVLSLMRAAVANLESREPARALTGPVARGDVATVRKHVEALVGERDALDVYVALSRAALGMLPEKRRDIAELLGR